MQSMADTTSAGDSSDASLNSTTKEGDDLLAEIEDELSEQQLRELYDREEIDRFLNLFAAVRLPSAIKFLSG